MNINFKKLNPYDAVIPTQATTGSAAYDLVATSSLYDKRTQILTVGFGLALELPEDYCALLLARSSISKRGLVLSNGVGLIDSDYRGELLAKFHAVTEEFYPYHVGDTCAQLLFLPIPKIKLQEVDELSDTVRGAGGFGSTDVERIIRR
jgi:dUTP pyrophosphatase